MRKKKLLAVSLLLVILQIVSLFAMIPASAAKGRYYAVYKAENAPTLDGIADSDNEAWDNVPWSENFYKISGGGADLKLTAKFKAMWTESVKEGVAYTNLWVYAYVEDGTTTSFSSTSSNYINDYFAISVANSSGAKLYSNGRTDIDLLPAWEDRDGNAEYIEESAKNETVASYKGVDVDLGWQDNRDAKTGTKYYAIEYMVSLPTSKIGYSFLLDVFFNDCSSTENSNNSRAGYCWDSMNTADAAPTGKAVLSNIPTTVADKVTHDAHSELSKAYTFYKFENAPNDDADWENLKWSEDFYKTGGSDNNAFAAKFKALWVDNTDTIDLLFYVFVKDSDDTQKSVGASWWTDDYVTISIDANRDGDDDDSGEIDSNFRAEVENIGEDGKITYYSPNITFDLNDKRTSYGYYIVTMCIPIDKALIVDNQINFDLMANNCGSSSSDVYTRIGWNGMNNTGYVGNGIGYLSEYSSPADEPISTEAGAGTRLNDPAGLRFESRINKAKYDALVDAGAEITTGTLIVPTDYLTEYGINNSNFTKANLDVLKVEYLDVVNNGWVNSTSADTDGYYKYYGSIVGIKTANLDRNFSGIGYMTVKTATEEYTVYGGYRAADHARSVQYVAAAAIASGEYNDYLTTLQSFIKDSAPAKVDGTTYRIMQYNLMKDGENWGGSALEIPYLASSVRKNITSAAIEGYNPDILVVNERFIDTWENLGLSSEKYTVIDVDLGDKFGDGNENKNVIVYKSDVFEEIARGGKAFDVSDGVNERNVCYAILEDKVTHKQIAVFATHWGTDSANHASQLADMQSCMNEVLTGEYADIPVVIAGDFNSLKNGTEYTTLLGTTYTDAVTSATSVDHIAVKGFSVVGQGMDTKSYTKFASDHKPIYADIKIGG